jgi:hypothetical protein
MKCMYVFIYLFTLKRDSILDLLIYTLMDVIN